MIKWVVFKRIIRCFVSLGVKNIDESAIRRLEMVLFDDLYPIICLLLNNLLVYFI